LQEINVLECELLTNAGHSSTDKAAGQNIFLWVILMRAATNMEKIPEDHQENLIRE
jgi:hypothetical protein